MSSLKVQIRQNKGEFTAKLTFFCGRNFENGKLWANFAVGEISIGKANYITDLNFVMRFPCPPLRIIHNEMVTTIIQIPIYRTVPHAVAVAWLRLPPEAGASFCLQALAWLKCSKSLCIIILSVVIWRKYCERFKKFQVRFSTW